MEKEKLKQSQFRSIIFFDGECMLCNQFIQFVLRNDVSNKMTFVSLQSDFAESFLTDRQIERDFTTIYFYDGGRLYDMSSAVLNIMLRLGFSFSLLYGFMIFPKFFRDSVYKFVSEKRHSVFSSANARICYLPSQEESKRIIR